VASTPVIPQHIQLEKAKSFSTPGASPSPSLAGAVSGQPSPALVPRINGAAPMNGLNGIGPAGPNGHQSQGAPLQNGHAPVAPPPPPPIYKEKTRAPGRGLADALIQSILVRTHYGIPVSHERKFRLEIPAHPKLAQQNFTVHIPANQFKLQIVPTLGSLVEQQRAHRLFVTLDGQMVPRGTPTPAPDDPLPQNALVFDALLHPGTNVIVVSVIAALPNGQKLPSGADCELESITIYAHLMKASA